MTHKHRLFRADRGYDVLIWAMRRGLAMVLGNGDAAPIHTRVRESGRLHVLFEYQDVMEYCASRRVSPVLPQRT